MRVPLFRVRRGSWVAVAALCAGVSASSKPLYGGGGPENVALVVNEDSWASMTIANSYIHLRKIPVANVIYLKNLPDFEKAKVDRFRERILRPALETLERRGVAPQIDYLIYSADIPNTIDVRGDVGKRTLPEVITPYGSVNGLTYLYRYTLAKNVGYLKLDINDYFRRRLPLRESEELSERDRERYREATRAMSESRWEDAVPILRELVERYGDVSILHYNLACALSRTGQADAAVRALQRAYEQGWVDYHQVESDRDLQPLASRHDFRTLIHEMKGAIFDVQPAQGFRGGYAWSRGRRVAEGEQRFLLSTMLGVTSGRGNSVREVLRYLARSAQADGTRPAGTIYYLANRNVRSTTRDWAFPSAIARLRELGVKAELLRGTVPKGRSDIAGVSTGVENFDWSHGDGVILPGAICEHFTSYAGALREGSGQTPLTTWLRYGAAGSCGTVAEPYALQSKFPFAFLHVYYAQGCSLAEAFYQAVLAPYQLLIVGDPLCQPWARIPTVTLEGLPEHVPGRNPKSTTHPTPTVDEVPEGIPVKGWLRLRPRVKEEDLRVDHYELFIDGRRAGACGPQGRFALDTTKLSDGYHELRVVAIRADPIETQGRFITALEVNNWGRALRVTPPRERNITWDQTVKVGAELPGAREIQILHNRRVLATIAGEKGEAEIAAQRLGQGMVTLHVVGQLSIAEGMLVMGKPIELEVLPPPGLPPLQLPAEARFTPGLLLTSPATGSVKIKETRKVDWLEKTRVLPGSRFELAGVFEVVADDVYQFQLRSNGDPVLEVDGQVLVEVTDERWHYVPVALQAGVHELRVRGRARLRPRLQLRFGGPGTWSVGAKMFRSLTPSP